MSIPSQTIVEPYRNFRYLLEIDGFASAGFNKVSGIDTELDVIDYREGGENVIQRKLPGQAKFSPLVVERGATFNLDMWNWYQSIVSYGGTPGLLIARKTVNIVLIGHNNKRLREWTAQNAWPSKWEIGDLDAKANEVLIERMTIQHEGLVSPSKPVADDLVTPNP